MTTTSDRRAWARDQAVKQEAIHMTRDARDAKKYDDEREKHFRDIILAIETATVRGSNRITVRRMDPDMKQRCREELHLHIFFDKFPWRYSRRSVYTFYFIGVLKDA